MEQLSKYVYTSLIENRSRSISKLLWELNRDELKWVLILIKDLESKGAILPDFELEIDPDSYLDKIKNGIKSLVITEEGILYIYKLLENNNTGGLVCLVYFDDTLKTISTIKENIILLVDSPTIVINIEEWLDLIRSKYILDKIDLVCWIFSSTFIDYTSRTSFRKDLRVANLPQIGFYLEECKWGNIFGNIKVLPRIPFNKIKNNEDKKEVSLDFIRLIDSYKKKTRISSHITLIKELINDNLATRNSVLDLGNCGLRDEHFYLLDELYKCDGHLKELILSNEWAECEDGQWKRVFSKNSSVKNKITRIPEQVKHLGRLKILRCGGDWTDNNESERWGIDDIKNILNLKNLEYLNLSNNNIQKIDGIENLFKLRILHLNNNRIGEIPDLKNLKSLKELYLSNNIIKKVIGIRGLQNIDTIDLHSNYIEDLRPIKGLIKKIGIVNNVWLGNTICIAKNRSLIIPPIDVIEDGLEHVVNYFDRFKIGKPYINNTIKIILTGNSEVGKSTLLKHLDRRIDIEQKHHFTHWLNIKELKSKYEIKKLDDYCSLRVFDFGGHDFYHDTHNIFFSQDTIFIILWDKDSNHLQEKNITLENSKQEKLGMIIQNYPLKYWLDSIKFYTKNKELHVSSLDIDKESGYNSVALVVQNKANAKEMVYHLNNNELHESYPFIYDILNIDILSKRNVEHFDSILHEVLNNTAIVGRKYPEYYGVIKHRIENYKGAPILTFNEFERFCIEIYEGLDTDDIKYLLSFLKKLGKILYYEAEEINDGIVFININYGIKLIHDILLELPKRNGIFDIHYINSIIDIDENEFIISGVIGLMENYKIIIRIPNTNDFIAPLYLPSKPSLGIDMFLKQCICPYRRFQYAGFMFKNVILCLFQHLKSYLIKADDSSYYWKDGLIISDDISDELLLLKFNLGNDSGHAYIDLFKINKVEKTIFSDKIIDAILHINKEYDMKEMITIDGTEYIPKIEILKNEEEGNMVFKYKNKYHHLVKFKDFLKIPSKMKTLFVSYSKLDLDMVNRFKDHLSALELDGKISHWYCTELMAGKEWDKEIHSKFDASDIVCFMISPNFMKTDYIHQYEIAKAFEKKQKNKNFKIVPIILDFCRWQTENNNLGVFTALPYTAKPIKDFDNQNMAWYIIQECIRLMIDNELDPVGDDFYSVKLPSDVLQIYERIVAKKVDRNSI